MFILNAKTIYKFLWDFLEFTVAFLTPGLILLLLLSLARIDVGQKCLQRSTWINIGAMFGVGASTAHEITLHVDGLVKKHLPIQKLPSTEDVWRLRNTTFSAYPTVFAAMDITESPRARFLCEEKSWHSGKEGCSTMMTIGIFAENGTVLGWETGIEGHNNDLGAWKQSKLCKWLVEVNKELRTTVHDKAEIIVQLLADGGFPGDEFVIIPMQ